MGGNNVWIEVGKGWPCEEPGGHPPVLTRVNPSGGLLVSEGRRLKVLLNELMHLP